MTALSSYFYRLFPSFSWKVLDITTAPSSSDVSRGVVELKNGTLNFVNRCWKRDNFFVSDTDVRKEEEERGLHFKIRGWFRSGESRTGWLGICVYLKDFSNLSLVLPETGGGFSFTEEWYGESFLTGTEPDYVHLGPLFLAQNPYDMRSEQNFPVDLFLGQIGPKEVDKTIFDIEKWLFAELNWVDKEEEASELLSLIAREIDSEIDRFGSVWMSGILARSMRVYSPEDRKKPRDEQGERDIVTLNKHITSLK